MAFQVISQKLLKFFNGTKIVVFLKISLAWFELGWGTVFLNYLALAFKRFKVIIIRNTCIKISCFIFWIKQWTFSYSRIIWTIFIRLFIGITKYKSSASSIDFPSIFVIHLVNSAQFLDAICVEKLLRQ